jgi:hypothetical protein
MLFTLGLKRFPPIDVLLGIAAGRAPMNQKALDYLLANLQTHYVNFNPKVFEGVAFLPATKPDGTQILAKPGEVSRRLLYNGIELNDRCIPIGLARSLALQWRINRSLLPISPPNYVYPPTHRWRRSSQRSWLGSRKTSIKLGRSLR